MPDPVKRWLLIAALAMGVSTAIAADDALPLFWVLGVDLFLWGTFWVLASEAAYFLWRFRKIGVFRSLATVVLMNLASTVCGFALLGIVPNEMAVFLGGGFAGHGFEALPSKPGYQVAGVLITFCLCYLASVLLEVLPLHFGVSGVEGLSMGASFRHCALCNLMSYVGLTALFLVVVATHWGQT